jgi:hypothetical protein
MVAALAADMCQSSRTRGITPAYALKIKDSESRLRHNMASHDGVRTFVRAGPCSATGNNAF